MPSYQNQAISPQIYTANAVVILIGSQEIGFGQTSSYNVGLGAEQFYQIGTALPGEIQQLRYSPSVTLNYFKLTNAGLTAFSYPLTTPLSSILANNKFNISVQDNTGAVLFTVKDCSASSFNMSVPANSPITEDIDFIGLDVWDSNGVSILNGNFALNFNSTNAVGAVVGATVS